MTTLEKIRAEIIEMNGLDYVEPISCEEVLDIIDKYEEQEPTSPCDLCRYDYMDGVCGDCPAMAKMVEPTCDTCEYNTAAFMPCNACEDKSEYKQRK